MSVIGRLTSQIVIRMMPELRERINNIAAAEDRRPTEMGRILLTRAVKAWEAENGTARR